MLELGPHAGGICVYSMASVMHHGSESAQQKEPGGSTFPAPSAIEPLAISLFASRWPLAVDAGCFLEQLAVGVA